MCVGNTSRLSLLKLVPKMLEPNFTWQYFTVSSRSRLNKLWLPYVFFDFWSLFSPHEGACTCALAHFLLFSGRTVPTHGAPSRGASFSNPNTPRFDLVLSNNAGVTSILGNRQDQSLGVIGSSHHKTTRFSGQPAIPSIFESCWRRFIFGRYKYGPRKRGCSSTTRSGAMESFQCDLRQGLDGRFEHPTVRSPRTTSWSNVRRTPWRISVYIILRFRSLGWTKTTASNLGNKVTTILTQILANKVWANDL